MTDIIVGEDSLVYDRYQGDTENLVAYAISGDYDPECNPKRYIGARLLTKRMTGKGLLIYELEQHEYIFGDLKISLQQYVSTGKVNADLYEMSELAFPIEDCHIILRLIKSAEIQGFNKIRSLHKPDEIEDLLDNLDNGENDLSF